MAHLGVAVGSRWTRFAVVVVVLLDEGVIRADRTGDRILALCTVRIIVTVGVGVTFGRGTVTLVADVSESSASRRMYVSRWLNKRPRSTHCNTFPVLLPTSSLVASSEQIREKKHGLFTLCSTREWQHRALQHQWMIFS